MIKTIREKIRKSNTPQKNNDVGVVDLVVESEDEENYINDDEEEDVSIDEFLPGGGMELERTLSLAASSSDVDDKWDEERQRLIPNGDLYESFVTRKNNNACSENEATSFDDEARTHLVAFSPSIGYSSINHDSFAIDKSNDDCNSNDEDDSNNDDSDNDLSYDTDEQEALNFSDAMLNDLRTEDSLFYSKKKGVTYHDRNHVGIMFQLYGSVWKEVFPYCVINFVWCYVIDYLNDNNIVALYIPSAGHSFMSILVAFLVVVRVQITYSRFLEARGYLGGIFKSFRELMHTVAILTDQSRGEAAREWRQSVASLILVTLRITVAAIEYESREEDPYDTIPTECLPDDIGRVRDFLENQAYNQEEEEDDDDNEALKNNAQALKKKMEALRAPIVFASSLRKVLLEPRKKKILDSDLFVPEQLKLLSHVTGFTQSVHGLNKLITTPFPFPLVQMSRTILFFWIFTLPMALMTDEAERLQISIIVFFVTYGFLGLEYVSIELDDPFGTDPNDFNSLAMAQVVYEDIYLILYQTDGVRYAEDLRKKLSQNHCSRMW